MSNYNHEIIRMENIYKSFPGVQALENVDFCLKKGEIHKPLEAIAFGFGACQDKLQPGQKVDLVYELEINHWNGHKDIQLSVIDYSQGIT